MVSLVFRDTNLFTAVASVCGVTLEPTRPTPPLGLRSDRPDPPCGLRSSAAADRTPPAVGRSALGAQTAKSACSLQCDARITVSLQSRQTRPVKRPPSLEAPLQASLSLSCATLARPCRCALPPNRRAPPPNTPTRRAARHPDGRPDPHFRLMSVCAAVFQCLSLVGMMFVMRSSPFRLPLSIVPAYNHTFVNATI